MHIKFKYIVLLLFTSSLLILGCGDQITKQTDGESMKIIFLHHSTGRVIWDGGVQPAFERYNSENGTSYQISEMDFPKNRPYGWKNYPYDYWNIWVNHAGNKAYVAPKDERPVDNTNVVGKLKRFAASVKNGDLFENRGEPTLEMLTQDYDMIIWKHCFPGSNILEDTGNPDVASEEKRIENYKLQYEALKNKMHEFPETTFLVWTGAALVEASTTQEKAQRAKEFFNWVRTDWDEPGDNIFLWDFRLLETEGDLYLKNEYAVNENDSHPNAEFAARVAPLFVNRITDVAEGRGDENIITGEK